jgi:hypothetical protein
VAGVGVGAGVKSEAVPPLSPPPHDAMNGAAERIAAARSHPRVLILLFLHATGRKEFEVADALTTSHSPTRRPGDVLKSRIRPPETRASNNHHANRRMSEAFLTKCADHVRIRVFGRR